MIIEIMRATAANAIAKSGIGGPQMSDERAAVETREMTQATRTIFAHLRHQKVVRMVNKHSNPHANCMMVSTCWPSVLERGN